VPLDSRPAIELQPRGLPIVVVPLLVEDDLDVVEWLSLP